MKGNVFQAPEQVAPKAGAKQPSPWADRADSRRPATAKQRPAKHIPFWFCFGYGTPMGWHASMKHSPEKGLCGA